MGDVSGKGAEAAAVTALARYTLRAAALEDGPPSAALRRLNAAMLYDDTSQFATVVARLPLGRRRTAASTCALALGRPPAARSSLRRDGSVETVGPLRHPGSACAPTSTCTTSTCAWSRATLLLLYTDGVTEAGPRDAPFGEDGLVAVLAGLAGQTPQAVVDAVERAVVAAQPGDPRDDIALLAIAAPTATRAAATAASGREMATHAGWRTNEGAQEGLRRSARLASYDPASRSAATGLYQASTRRRRANQPSRA